MDAQNSLKSFELENNIIDVNSNEELYDELYNYDEEEQKALRQEEGWKQE